MENNKEKSDNRGRIMYKGTKVEEIKEEEKTTKHTNGRRAKKDECSILESRIVDEYSTVDE